MVSSGGGSEIDARLFCARIQKKRQKSGLRSEKVAAEALPVVGAAGGASINLLFIDHFQDVAQAHFTIRKLERKYGQDAVRAEYERIKRELVL